ncbi:MAG: ABC transporter ATP-binding protein [Schleiferiaceae bacterium]|nr:ABC transporter ATP-binding protein [Schleiferiaceae bacterium]
MSAPVVHIEHLSIAFDGHQVLRDFTFTLNPGQTIAVVGESGSGKSVAALMAMGLLDKRAEIKAVAAQLFNDNLLSFSSEKWSDLRGNEVAMVFQDPMTSLHPSIRIGRQLEEVLERHTKLDRVDREKAVIEALREVEISDPESSSKKYPHEMSGGQRQRVVIAMAMLLKPKLIIADEPTTALDKAVEGKILALLNKLVKDSGAALWLISHDLEVVAEVADEVVVLFRGETVETGPAKQVFTAPKHPYTKGLLGCRPPKEGRPFPLPVLDDFLNDTVPSKQVDLAAPKSAEEVMTITGLRIGFERRSGFRKTKQWIINDLDIHLNKAETLGLIGPSGSGKSSIGRAIVGLNSFESTTFSYSGDTSKIQFIFQDPFSALNGSKRVGWILDSVLKRHRPELSLLERSQEAQVLLEEVGLTAADLKKRPKAFSGGQRQRIGIARALAASPEVLICDESVSALDVSVQSQVLNVLNGIKKNRGLSMIFISHDPDVIRYMCDRIVRI